LQRKITKATTIEEQLEIAVKAFNEKCFTTKQVKELGAIFWEEQNRLTFYTRIRNYVADPSLYGELEQSFLQEASKKAFRDMLKKQQL
jgi:protease II